MTFLKTKICPWKKLGWLALALPFLAMLVMMGTNLRALNNTEYRIAIEGFDPRDLLRGHYLTFQYQWPENLDKSCNSAEKNCCACFTGNPDKPDITHAPCKTLIPSCPALLPLTSHWNNTFQPDEKLRRYYIPEQHAKKLDTMLRENKAAFSIGLVLQGDQHSAQKSGKVKMLYIDNMTLPQFLKNQK